jgi:fructose-1,6-bisphosphatase
MQRINQLLSESALTMDQLSAKTKSKIKDFEKLVNTPKTFKGYFDKDGKPNQKYQEKLAFLLEDITEEVADKKIAVDEAKESENNAKLEAENKAKAEQEEKDKLAKEEADKAAKLAQKEAERLAAEKKKNRGSFMNWGG